MPGDASKKQSGQPTASSKTDTVRLDDGTVMQMARLPEVDETTWGDMKHYLEKNPEIAKGLQNFSKNPVAMRGWLQTQAIAEHYQSKSNGGSEGLIEHIEALENDEEVGHIFVDVRTKGLEAAMKYWSDQDLMLKISDKLGGLPSTLQATLKKIDDTPLSFHEAAKVGDLRGVTQYLKKGQPADAPDLMGITPLGYAIGANKIAVVKALLDVRANADSVDSEGNSGMHYAAGYGRKELLEYLLQTAGPAAIRKANARGQTALALASLNQQQACVALLKKHGAR
mmetsp:Transcript_24163/g.53573  ORF Transcript_24163/g.53573 Transcript_24163/m.53573 type:complete len:283 (+) Transcript_24163:121-969(+)